VVAPKLLALGLIRLILPVAAPGHLCREDGSLSAALIIRSKPGALIQYKRGCVRVKESPYAAEMNTTISTVVDGIAVNLLRLHGLGLRNIVVANLASMACSPYITVASNYTACSRNSTLAFETRHHNALLVRRVRLLKRQLRGANFVIVDQTKAFQHIFHHGSQYGKIRETQTCKSIETVSDAFLQFFILNKFVGVIMQGWVLQHGVLQLRLLNFE